MNARRPAPGLMVVLGVLLNGAPAMADVIDGDWCHDDGRHFSIQGPIIITPAGKPMQGQYTRHTFRYRLPPMRHGQARKFRCSYSTS